MPRILPRALLLACGLLALTLSLGLGLPSPSLAQSSLATSVPLSAYPPNISFGSGGPMVMLTASRDHTLFSPIYTDYEDLDGDGQDDYTYKPTFRYYGYFDADKCYAYNATRAIQRFEPVAMPAKIGVGEAGSSVPKASYLSCKGSTGRWSGNFLNWATMTRIDVVRKTLYGGYRREDTLDTTTLEMAQMSHDAHAFVKYYSGSDIEHFTPFTLAGDLGGKGLTLCSRGAYSRETGVNGYPLIRLAKGNFSLWGTTPRTVCNWAEEDNYSFGVKARLFYAKYGPSKGRLVGGDVDPTAHAVAVPSYQTDGATYGPADAKIGIELAVRVQACKADLIGKERCRAYRNPNASASDPAVLKPIGLLQEFATTSAPEQAALAEFGLITGSYDSNLRGGVLRKNMGSVNDEVDLYSGRFCHNVLDKLSNCAQTASSGQVAAGIIVSFDRIRLYSAGDYNNDRAVRYDLPHPSNPPNLAYLRPQDLVNGDHASWGNPISEMVVQALAYFAGDTQLGIASQNWPRDTEVGLPTPRRDGSGSVVIVDPLDDAKSKDPATQRLRSSMYGKGICRPMNVLAISSGTVSYDTDEPGSSDDIYDVVRPFFSANVAGGATLAGLTDKVGQIEHINNTARSVGSSTAGFGSDCTSKQVGTVVTAGLANVAGVCPEAPGIKGSYLGAGAAFAANTHAIREMGNRQVGGVAVASSLTADTGANVRLDKLPQHALRVKSYAASLAGGVPRIEVPIGTSGKRVYITPESSWRHNRFNDDQLMPGAVLTFKALDVGRNDSTDEAYGSYVVTWNDAQFGGDYDMDLIGFIRWETKPIAGNPGAYELKVLTDVLGHEAGAQGSHGYSIIGTQANPGGTYQVDGRYLTHGSNGYASSSMCRDRKPSQSSPESAEFVRLCKFNDGGMDTGQGGHDSFAWAMTPGEGSSQFLGKNVVFADQYVEGTNVTTTVTQTFLVKDGASPVTLRDPLWYIAKYGSFDTGEKRTEFHVSTDATPDEPGANGASTNWDSQSNAHADQSCVGSQCADGEPDGYFLARRPELLEQRLRQLFSGLTAASNSAPAVSSAELLTGSFKYRSEFSRDTFNGNVRAFALLPTGQFSTTVAWDASGKLTDAGSSRKIITQVAGVGVDFALVSDGADNDSNNALLRPLLGLSATDTIGATQRTAGIRLVNYMRGDTSFAGTLFRARGEQGIMGPVVNSTPWLQDSQAAARYIDTDFASQPSYLAYVLNKAEMRDKKPVQPNVLWVGSFDGMLHGFNANTGDPILSFVPGALLGQLGGALARSTSDPKPLMDGSPYTADVLVPRVSTATGGASTEWRTYLFSSLGRGGRAVFALDVTYPASLAGRAPASIVKWSFTADDDRDLGFNLIDPVRSSVSGQASQVVYLNNGRFGVLQPNGYRSEGGRAVLFILNAAGPGTGAWRKPVSGDPGNYVALTTSTTDSNNGLMGVTWADLDNNGTADIAYGTDLKGQVWRFDLRSANPAEWGVALISPAQASVSANSRSGLPLFSAKDGSNKVLPITTAPALTFPSFGGIMVSFGTGRAIEAGDFPDFARAQRFFTVWDRGSYSRTMLGGDVQDTMFPAPTTGGNELPDLGGTKVKPGTGTATSAGTSVSTFVRRVAVRETTGADAGQVFIAQLNEDGTVKRDASGKAVPLGATDVAPRFDPTVNDGWYFELPSASDAGEALISSPVSRLNFVLFTTVRGKSADELSQSCGSGPQGSLFVLSPINGLPIRNILVDGRNLLAVDVNDQKLLAVRDGSDGSTGLNRTRVVGDTENRELQTPATNLRVQWREIPGLKTK